MTTPTNGKEGEPNRCPICGLRAAVDRDAAGDAICPNCARLLAWFANRLKTPLDVPKALDPRYGALVGSDSLDMVELLGELHDQFGVELPADPGQFITIADWIRYADPPAGMSGH